MPLHEHDCTACTFLGTDSHGKDWYVCGPEESRSLIRRHSGKPSDYSSVPIGMCVKMTSLEQLALRMGFEFNNYELVRFGKIYTGEKREFFSANDVCKSGIGLDDWDLLDQSKKEVKECPNCGCQDPPLEGDDVHEGYDGFPVCPECRAV